MTSGAGRAMAAAAAACALLSGTASAQQAGVLDWSALGLADEAGVPRAGLETTSAGVLASVSWRVDTNGGFAAAPGEGQDFVSYEAASQGGETGFAQLAFDAASREQADRIVLFVQFNEMVTDTAFTLTDVDLLASNKNGSGYEDAVSVFFDRGAGYELATGAAFPAPTRGAAVGTNAAATFYGAGWEGIANAAPSSTAGNLRFTFVELAFQRKSSVGGGFGGAAFFPFYLECLARLHYGPGVVPYYRDQLGKGIDVRPL